MIRNNLLKVLRLDTKGVAATEFALVSVVFLTFVVAVIDIGGAIHQRLVLQQAVRAGAQYAVSFPTQSAGIRLAVQKALPTGWNDVTITSTACVCADDGTCGACGGSTGGYVTLQVKRPYSTFLSTNLGNCPDRSLSNCASLVVRFQ